MYRDVLVRWSSGSVRGLVSVLSDSGDTDLPGLEPAATWLKTWVWP